MELQHLRSFLEVSSELSFTRAAKKLNYAQSSVTAQIQHLEASLGAMLFDRRGRRIALTESGLRLRPVAERIVELADLAHREVAGSGERLSGSPGESGRTRVGQAARPGPVLPLQRRPVQLVQGAPRAGSNTSQAARTRVIRSSSSRTDPR